jgi:hypothetical protein
MKKYVLLLCLFSTLYSNAQIVTVACNASNMLYAGVDNSIDISVSNYDCDSVSLQASSGTFKQNRACSYSIYVKDETPVTIQVTGVKNGERVVLKKLSFDVVSIPDPVAHICGIDGNEVKPSVLKVQKGICAQQEELDITVKYEILSFKMFVIKDGGKTRTYTASGPYFNERMVEEILGIFNGDVIVIKDIQCKLPSGGTVELKPLVYNVKSTY